MLRRRCIITLVSLYIMVAGMACTAASVSLLPLDDDEPAPVVATAVEPVTPAPAAEPEAESPAGRIFWTGPEEKDRVALTFDDGPHPEYTPAILAVLAKYNVKATFFMVGENAGRHPAIVREVALKGHEVADHTMTHPEAPKADSRKLMREVRGAAELLEQLSGQKVHYFRPPYGYFDVAYFRACRDAKLDIVLWSIVPRDWERPPAEILARRVAAEIRPGAIVLLHDGGGDRRQTVKALPAILEAIRAKGLRPVTLSQLLN